MGSLAVGHRCCFPGSLLGQRMLRSCIPVLFLCALLCYICGCLVLSTPLRLGQPLQPFLSGPKCLHLPVGQIVSSCSCFVCFFKDAGLSISTLLVSCRFA